MALIIFPSARAAIAALFRRAAQALARLGTRTAHRGSAAVGGASGAVGRGSATVFGFFSKYRWQSLTVLLILLLPSLFTLLLRHNYTFSYVEDTRGPDARIQALLVGERLIPPAPLPPESFTTREVELVRPNLGGASRDWNLLDADFRQRLLLVFQIMRDEHGYEMVLLEGYRSPERQNQLAARGSHVTNAGAFQSWHQYGLAADSAFYREGKVVISEKDPWAMRGYELYGEASERVGLTWGGRWKMMDFGHVELRRPGVMKRRQPENAVDQ